MANPAIIAGLLAGYTVGAVLTAIAVAKDLTPADAAAGRSAGVERGVCARALGTARRAPRCLRTGAHDGLITLRR